MKERVVSQKDKWIKSFIIILIMVMLVISSAIFVEMGKKSSIIIELLEEISIVNTTLGIITIPTCCLYYYMYKNQEVKIFIICYISILIEYVFVYFGEKVYLLDSYFIKSLFIIKFILLIYIMINMYNNKITKLVFKISSIAIVLIHIIGISSSKESYINSDKIASILSIAIFLIFYFTLFSILLVSIKNSKMINVFFCMAIGIFAVRGIIFSIMNDYETGKYFNYNKVLTFIGFSTILSGLFIEMLIRIKERERLLNNIQISKEKINEIQELQVIRISFFANMSHELRTPINIIFSCVQLLDLNLSNSDEDLVIAYKKYTKSLKQNCYRMLRLVNNLIDSSKMDLGYMKLEFTNIDIINLVESITRSVIPHVEHKNINIVFDTMVEELELKCNVGSIERIILNLLSNAIKFTEDNGNIQVNMDVDEKWVTISVKDDGIGIDEKIKDTIFEKFLNADKSSKKENEGSGIGLSLVKKLVELHDGEVYLNDNNEKGSEFIVKLPNIKCNEEYKEIEDNKKYKSTSIEKINIEISDIYNI